MAAIPDGTRPRIPRVGVGCIVVRPDGQVLMVQNHRGFWSTPGGHLDFGESPAECAVRETFEETGLQVTEVEFVAITNDLLSDLGRHYITIWMRASAAELTPVIGDRAEIADAGWFAPTALPEPRHLYFENLIAGRCLPPNPTNLPFRVGALPVPGAVADPSR
jgi:8-oxo-dGTP diphosphatase